MFNKSIINNKVNLLRLITEDKDTTNYADAANGSITKPVVGDKTLEELLCPKIEPGDDDEIDDSPQTQAEWDKSKFSFLAILTCNTYLFKSV